MSPKFYALDLTCPACGDDDRYCEACVGAILHAQARMLERRAEGYPGLLRVAWRSVFGYVPPPPEQLVLPSTTDIPSRRMGAIVFAPTTNGATAKIIVCAEEYGTRRSITDSDQCQRTKAPTCERFMCTEHCNLVCRVECPNQILVTRRRDA